MTAFTGPVKPPEPKRAAVIGAGAAGLVVGRKLRDAGVCVTVFEKEHHVGGVWKYRPGDVIYRGLVTNLPKEIMGYREYPFDPRLPSFVSHRDVQAYLESYACHFDLTSLITFGADVVSVRPRLKEAVHGPLRDFTVDDGKADEEDPVRWELVVRDKGTGEETVGEYDAVVVCNGHFDLPSTPHLPGSEAFVGRIVHSRDYDDPQEFAGQRVLCVGYRSSGTDIAKEVAGVAKEVHVVDRSFKPEVAAEVGIESHGNIFRRPHIARFGQDGRSVEFGDGTTCQDLDVMILCTGYEYCIPFLVGGHRSSSTSSGDAIEAQTQGVPGQLVRLEDRAVHPVYQHLFHAYWPSLSFMGLLHSVVPLPMFELQAQWIVEVLRGKAKLPDRSERFAWLEQERQRLMSNGQRARDWHYMGVRQWDYCRELARAAGCLSDDLERFLTLNQQVYEDVQRSRPPYPGGPDLYRRRQYKMEYDAMRWTVELAEESQKKELLSTPP